MTKAFLLVPLLVAALSACFEPDVRQVSYENSKRRELASFEFKRPLPEVWPLLVDLLAEDGYLLPTQPVTGKTVFSELREGSRANTGYRALVHVTLIEGERYRLRIQFQYQGYDRESDKLDLSIDPNADSLPGKMMTLIERAEPRRASQIFKKIRDS